MLRIIGWTLGIMIPIALVVGACSVEIEESTPDEVMLHYDAGPLTAERFKDCVAPSQRNIVNAFDKHYKYPAGQRTWDFTGGEGAERGAVSVTDSSAITLNVAGILTFTLNSDLAKDCAALQEFHERIGLKYDAFTDEGWNRMLQAYLGNPVEKALDQASQKYTWRELLQDEKVRDDWETEVGRLARVFARDQAGGDYFCDPSYTGRSECGDFVLTLQKPILPESITEALERTEAEKELENQALAAKDRIDTEAETLQSLVDVLGRDTAVLFWAIKEGDVDVMPVPFGSDVVVNNN